MVGSYYLKVDEGRNMQVQTLVKLTNTKDRTELYQLFCCAAQGDFVDATKCSPNSSEIANLEDAVSKAFDSFAQQAFDKGREYERSLSE